jgi:hypothetical protein
VTPQQVAGAILAGASRMKVDLCSTLDISDEAFAALVALARPTRADLIRRIEAVDRDADVSDERARAQWGRPLTDAEVRETARVLGIDPETGEYRPEVHG